MKKILFAIALLLSIGASAQFKYIQNGNYILRFDSTAISYTPMRSGTEITSELRQISNDALLVRTYFESVIFFNSAPVSANVTQIPTSTGLWLLTCPTNITTTKGIMVGQSYLEYSSTTHSVAIVNGAVEITRTADDKRIAAIYPYLNNAIIWDVAPSTVTLPFGSSGIKRIVVP